jgi:hypothetical protein
MNTPRQPNARPSGAPFLSQTRTMQSEHCESRRSFVAPLTVSPSPAAVKPSVTAADRKSSYPTWLRAIFGGKE